MTPWRPAVGGAAALMLASACSFAPQSAARELVIPGSQVFTERSSALADDAVTDITVSPTGEIWVATAGGITIVDGTGRMKRSSTHGRNYCHQVAFSPDGKPWVHCGIAGLSAFDGQSWVSPKLPAEGYSIANVAFDDRQQPWVATNVGLFASIAGTWREVQLAHSGVLKWSAISCVAAHSERFMLAQVLLYGLVKINTETLEYERVLADVEGGCPLRVDRAGSAWFATKNGLYRLQADELAATPDQPRPVADFRVVDIAFDALDRPWISTRYGGIHAFDGKRWITVAPEQPDLDDDTFGTLPIAFDREGNLWAGGAIVYYFRRAEGTGLLRVPHGALPMTH